MNPQTTAVPFPIAVVGMGLRFPGGASTPEKYWSLLREGRQTARAVPPERWDQSAFYDPDPERPGRGYLNRASFLDEDIRAFDARFFGILPREAATMDPQIRLTLEIVWEAFEQAGLRPADYRGESTGVYLSAFVPDYFLLAGQNFNAAFADPWHATGVSLAMIANRVSFSFDFRGPSMTVDTACSGSHSAIYLACQEIWRGAAELAIAGGVSLMAYPNAIASLCRARFLAPDGLSKPFDARADGYGKGEGAGVALLCPLDFALERGMDIHGLIVGAAANQDGRTDGITVPSLAAQKTLIETTWKQGGLDLGRAGFVEAHGTGTAVGDPIEARALGETFGAARPPGQACWIGSAKANIGHTEAAAGIASVIKVLLSFRHDCIPRQTGFEQPNPQIPFAAWGLRIPRENIPWPKGELPRLAGINGFGYGGSNCHLVLQEPPPSAPRKISASAPVRLESGVLPLSARSPEALTELAGQFVALLAADSPPRLADLCAGAGRRTPHGIRAAFSGEVASIRQALEAFAAGRAHHGWVSGRPGRGAPRLAFHFSEPTAIPLDAASLLEEPEFARTLQEIDAILKPLAGSASAGGPEVAHFAVQVGVFRLLTAWGFVPEAVSGTGWGEIPAAFALGRLTLESATQLAWRKALGESSRSAPGTQTQPACDVVVNIGAGGDLPMPGGSAGGEASPRVLSVTSGGRVDRLGLLDLAARLYVAGAEPDWKALHPGADPLGLALPNYPWQREVHWFSTPGLQRWTHPRIVHPLLGQRSGPLPHRWAAEPGFALHPWLRDHAVSGLPVFPAAAFVEMLFAAARESALPETGPLALEKIVFADALLLGPGPYPTLHSEIDAWGGLSIRSETFDLAGAERTTLHATARVPAPGLTPAAAPGPSSAVGPWTDDCDGTAFASLLQGFNLQYGPAFQGLESIRFQDRCAFATVRLRDEVAVNEDFLCHPCLLDLCFQTSLALCARQGIPRGNWLPVSLRRATFFQSTGRSCTVWSRLEEVREDSCTGDLTVFGENGAVSLVLEGLTLRRIGPASEDVPADWFYEDRWRRAAAPAAPSLPLAVWAPGGQRWAAALARCLPPIPVCLENHPSLQPGLALYEFSSSAVCPEGPAWCAAVATAGWAVLEFARTCLPFADTGKPLRVIFLTRGALRLVPSDTAPDLVAASLWGVFRSLMKERSDLDILAVDLPSDPATDPPAETLLDYFFEEPLAREGAWRNGEFLLREVGRYAAGDQPAAESAGGGPDAISARLEIGTPGKWNSLDFRAGRRRAPQPDEMEVRVSHAALNYKDALKVGGLASSDLLAASASGSRLGFECAGVVERAGCGSGFQPGDEVVCWGIPEAFQTFVTLASAQALARPESLPAEYGGAQIPLLTAWRALVDLARLQRGETVLIHSAAGGVGHYAVEIAQALGATVYATAGTAEKRRHLLRQGVAEVFDSRSLDFAPGIRRITGGVGVDVVLNSLTGEALTQSFGLLASHGRFVEIGKRDILEGRPLDLAGFHRNISFFAVDLDEPGSRWAASLRRSLSDALAMLQEGRIRLPPLEVFPAAAAATAFRKMAGGTHLGRLSLRLDPVPLHPAPPRPGGAVFRKDRSYLITGGLGEIGFALARWLASAGAGHLILSGRSAPEESRRRDFTELATAGASVHFFAADVACPADCARLREFLHQLPPLAGIFHAAGVVNDALIETMTAEAFVKPLQAKVAGTWNLHELALEEEVEHFVLLSSIASSWGSPGQTNYAAGNAFQDALVENRLREGWPALSVNFGPFSGQRSMAQRFDRADAFFEAIGLPLMPPAMAGAAITRLLREGRRRATVACVKWASWIQGFPREARGARFGQLAASFGQPAAEGTVQAAGEQIRSAPPEERQGLIIQALCELIARETQVPIAQIDPQLALREIGIDSLSSVAIDIRIRETFGVTIPFLQLFQEPSLLAIAARIEARLEAVAASKRL